MFDINTLLKQEDLNRKLNLLKQIKLSIESLMFDPATNTNRSSWQSLGIITVLSRHVLAILEDNIDTNTNENMSNSNSPGTTTNSRSITQSSIEINTSLFDDALWCFILFIFKSDNATNINNNNEVIAKKEFELIYAQIKQLREQELADMNEFNFAFNWIQACLRQNLLLNQLTYLLTDSNLIEKFYKPQAFLIDRLFVNDFLNFIKAYETRDFNVLRKIKRNFYTPNNSQSILVNNNINDKNIRSLTFNNIPTTRSSSSSSHASSINNIVNFNEISSVTTSTTITNAADNNNNSNSLELAINEMNLATKLKNTHRRMHSIPNIQINEIKRNRLLMNESVHVPIVVTTTTTTTKSANLNESDSTDQNESIQSESLDSSSPPSIVNKNIEENQLSASTLLLNNQIESNLRKSISEANNDDPYYDVNNNNEDIYEKTTVFDFIHSQQINCDCNQVDKENSHFIIADIAITAFELIKTQDLNDLNQLDEDTVMMMTTTDEYNNSNNSTKLRKNQNLLTINTINKNKIRKNRIKSNEINISKNIKNSMDTTSLQFGNSFNSSISPIPNGIFSGDDYASSYEKEVFFASGCVSPNTDVLSSSSIMSIPKQNNNENSKQQQDHKKGHKKSLSLVVSSNVHSKSDLELETKQLFKSLSSNNIADIKTIPENQVPSSSSTDPITTTKAIDLEHQLEEEELDDDESATVSTLTRPTINIFSPNTSFNNHNHNNNNMTSSLSQLVHNSSSSATLNSIEVQSNRTRRFSWEEIINLDTAENIANRLIEKLIENENNHHHHQRKISSKLAQVPSLKQFEIFIQLLEYLEYMQTYYELRSSGALHKYIQLFANNNSNNNSNKQVNHHLSASSIYQLRNVEKQQPSVSKTNNLLNSLTKTFEKSIKTKTSIISKIKIAAAAAVSINQFNLDQQKIATNLIRILPMMDDIELKHNNSSLPSKDKMMTENGGEDLNKSISSSSSSKNNNNNSYKTLNPRILGDESWAPVRDQLIVHYTPKQKRIDQMQQQHFRCADCGIQVHKDKMKSFKYCEYYCKYFCRCCHIGNQSYIPAYIVNALDFKTKYEVSKKAKNFLETIYNQPVINLESLNTTLFERSNIFSKFKKVRCKLNNCRHYINSCRFAIDLKNFLTSQFDDFIINDQMAYSIEILFKIKQTNYFEILKKIVNDCMEHIRKCELCSQQGYICGLCNSNELLYPFDLDKVQKCENCLACCHKNCLKKPELCPRCKRKQNRIMQTTSAGTVSK